MHAHRVVEGGGYSEIIIYIRRLGPFWGGLNFEFHLGFFLGGQKNEYFWGLKILWICFGVITKLD